MAELTEEESVRRVLEKGGLLGRIFENEMRYLASILPPFGHGYHDFLRSYNQEDRGLSQLLRLEDYLFHVSSESNNNHQDRGVILQLEEIAIESTPYIPAMREELGILKTLRDKTSSSLEKASHAVRRKPPTLTPQEFVDAIYDLGSLRIFLDCMYALVGLRYDILVQRMSTRDVLRRYLGVIRAFVRSLESPSSHFYMHPRLYPNSMVTLFAIDSHDNSLLKDLLNTGNEKLLLTYIPRKGLDEVLFNNEKRVKERFEKVLGYGIPMRDMCLPSNLKARLVPKKLREYYKALYPDDENTYFT